MRRTLLLACATAMVVVLALPALAGVNAHIAVEDFSFTPSAKTVPTASSSYQFGFDNGGSFTHTATANSGMFDTGDIGSGLSGTVALYGAGTYTYHCIHHPTLMKGTLKMRPTADHATISVGQTVTLHVGADSLKGVNFDVQRRRNGGAWTTVRSQIGDSTPTFTLTQTGTFEFRARTRLFIGGSVSGWSPLRKVIVSAT